MSVRCLVIYCRIVYEENREEKYKMRLRQDVNMISGTSQPETKSRVRGVHRKLEGRSISIVGMFQNSRAREMFHDDVQKSQIKVVSLESANPPSTFEIDQYNTAIHGIHHWNKPQCRSHCSDCNAVC